MFELLWYLLGHGCVPVCISGAPGCGKTAQVVQFAQQMRQIEPSFLFHTLYIPALAPEEYGIGVYDYDAKIYKKTTPEWALPFVKQDNNQNRPGIIFLDEINSINSAFSLKMLNTLIQEHRLPNGAQLSDKILFVAAMNGNLECGGELLPPDLMNRFTHVTCVSEYAATIEWMFHRPKSFSRGLTAIQTMDDVMIDIQNNPTKWENVYQFLSEAGKQGVKITPDEELTRGELFVSARSLAMFTALIGPEINNPVEWAYSLFPEQVATIIESINVASIKDAASALFDAGDKEASTEEEAHLAKRQDVIAKVRKRPKQS